MCAAVAFADHRFAVSCIVSNKPFSVWCRTKKKASVINKLRFMQSSAEQQPSRAFPSTGASSLISNLENSAKKDLNKIAKKMGKKLFFKERPVMSPPSTSSSTAFNYENANHSNRNFPLTIDVENPARSSWPEVDVHDQPTQAVRRAQQIALDMIRQRIKSESEELHRIRDDQKVLADVIAENYSAQLSTDVEQTQKKIKELDRALQELRLKYPTLVPPPRPPRRPSYMEGNETWQCVRCAAETAGHSYRCVRCQLPRSNIDPREAQRCGCVTCSSSLGEKLFVSMSPGDDGWTLIDKLGWPINSTSS